MYTFIDFVFLALLVNVLLQRITLFKQNWTENMPKHFIVWLADLLQAYVTLKRSYRQAEFTTDQIITHNKLFQVEEH